MLNTPICLPETPVNEACVFVDLNNGSDANPGTKESPVKTPHKGLSMGRDTTLSKWGQVRSVVISSGNYYFNSSINATDDNSLMLVKGQSIYGGYEPSLAWQRNIKTYITHIEDINSVAATGVCTTANCPAVIYVNNELDNSTIIDGLEIQASKANNHTANLAIWLNLPATTSYQGPIISNNIVRGGTINGASGAYTIAAGNLTGLIIRNNMIYGGQNSGAGDVNPISVGACSKTLIENNTFSGGNSSGGGNYTGIWIGSGSSDVTVQNNTITLGTSANNIYGISLAGNPNAGSIRVSGNAISGGQLNCLGVTCELAGIGVTNTAVNLVANTVVTGSATGGGTKQARGIRMYSGATGSHLFSANTIRLNGTGWDNMQGIDYDQQTGTQAAQITDNTLYMPANNVNTYAQGFAFNNSNNSSIEIARNTIYGGAGSVIGPGVLRSIAYGPNGAAVYSVHDNRIYRNAGGTTPAANDTVGIYTVGNFFNNYIEVFNSSGNESRGLTIYTAGAVVYNNIVIHSGSVVAAFTQSTIYLNAGATNTQILNNTLVTFNGTGASSANGISMNQTGSTPAIKNNLIVLRGSISRYGMYEIAAASPAALQNNLVYDAGSGGTAYAYVNNGGNACATNPACTALEMNIATNTTTTAGNASGNIGTPTYTPTFIDSTNESVGKALVRSAIGLFRHYFLG